VDFAAWTGGRGGGDEDDYDDGIGKFRAVLGAKLNRATLTIRLAQSSCEQCAELES